MLGDAAHAGDADRVLGVQRRAHVQAAHRGVAVEARPRVLALDERREAGHELLQPLGRHGGVLDERDRLLRLGRAQEQRQDRLAQRHRAGHVPRRQLGAALRPHGASDLGQGVHARAHPVGLAAVLDQQHRRRVAGHERGGVAVGGVGPRALERHAVEQLDVGRVGVQQRRRGRGGRSERSELQRGHPPLRRQRVQAQVDARHHRQRALGPADQPRQVEDVGVDERVQAVARHPPHDLRVAAADLVAVALAQLQGAAQQPGLGVLAAGAPLGLGAGQRAQLDGLAAGQHAAQPHDLVGRRAVHERAHPGRVVADHAAERGHVRRRRVGAEDQPVGRDARVELALDRAGPHRARARGGVVGHDRVQGGDVEGQARRGGLARQARCRCRAA